MSYLTSLHDLDMSSGNLSGPILKPLWNLTNTENLSLENNNLEGTIYPFFKFGKLKRVKTSGKQLYRFNSFQCLRSNKLHGPIKATKNKKLFAKLQIMDLSSNGFSGNLPASIFENFQAMKIIDENVRDPCYLYLSHWISHLTKLGGIPQQLAFLTSLEVPNLSHNHLIGWIPKGKQFDTFDKSSYQGNDGLHGFPLSKDCGDDDGVPQTITPVELDEEEEEDSPMISWQAVLMSYGCGLVSVLSIIYIILSTQTPAWF
ncbi:hypothetical protein CQW23_07873 [Capsicum baccatum]|uniref:Uncharacterized protein n=1 Tax=Capsicum baccatum TaxID=33114 RepID=A0A2G2X7U9_CAPBA|nr:hypothetical protein CQW23_07873 [Capsicum baccatum]